MATQSHEAFGELSLGADGLLDGCAEIVVDDTVRHAAQILEGPDVSIQEGELVGTVVRAINLAPPSITHPKKSRPR